jgi:hypothetical protein
MHHALPLTLDKAIQRTIIISWRLVLSPLALPKHTYDAISDLRTSSCQPFSFDPSVALPLQPASFCWAPHDVALLFATVYSSKPLRATLMSYYAALTCNLTRKQTSHDASSSLPCVPSWLLSLKSGKNDQSLHSMPATLVSPSCDVSSLSRKMLETHQTQTVLHCPKLSPLVFHVSRIPAS